MSQPKVALITGSARRIGAAIARALHKSGMRIVLHYYTSEQAVKKLCDELNVQRANSAIAIKTNLCDFAALPKLIEEATRTWGQLDVLINNASRFYRTPIGQAKEAAWSDLMTSNLQAPYFLSQAAAPFLKPQQGCIINIADIHGRFPLRDYSIYCISKAGLLMLTKSLAKELAPYIRVNSVSPGSVDWPEGENALDESAKQKILSKTALGRAGSAEDIAQAVLFLVKNGNYMTGTNVVVDGGRS